MRLLFLGSLEYSSILLVPSEACCFDSHNKGRRHRLGCGQNHCSTLQFNSVFQRTSLHIYGKCTEGPLGPVPVEHKRRSPVCIRNLCMRDEPADEAWNLRCPPEAILDGVGPGRRQSDKEPGLILGTQVDFHEAGSAVGVSGLHDSGWLAAAGTSCKYTRRTVSRSSRSRRDKAPSRCFTADLSRRVSSSRTVIASFACRRLRRRPSTMSATSRPWVWVLWRRNPQVAVAIRSVRI